MRVFAADGNNDLYIGADGRLAINDGLRAVMQAVQQAVQTQLGEMVLSVDQGVPNFQSIWNGAPNLSVFRAYLRATILAVENVTGIESLETTVANNKLTYSATITTTFGTGALNG
jgi:hypothetical protein